jgi:hypothetical protein
MKKGWEALLSTFGLSVLLPGAPSPTPQGFGLKVLVLLPSFCTQ